MISQTGQCVLCCRYYCENAYCLEGVFEPDICSGDLNNCSVLLTDLPGRAIWIKKSTYTSLYVDFLIWIIGFSNSEPVFFLFYIWCCIIYYIECRMYRDKNLGGKSREGSLLWKINLRPSCYLWLILIMLSRIFCLIWFEGTTFIMHELTDIIIIRSGRFALLLNIRRVEIGQLLF